MARLSDDVIKVIRSANASGEPLDAMTVSDLLNERAELLAMIERLREAIREQGLVDDIVAKLKPGDMGYE